MSEREKTAVEHSNTSKWGAQERRGRQRTKALWRVLGQLRALAALAAFPAEGRVWRPRP
jgi:hypothetical protein